MPHDILNTPDSQRDEKWEDVFLQALSQTQLSLLAPDPKTGPDSWPYLMTTTEAKGATPPEPAQKILHWLSTRGIGLVINPEKDYPDFILPYGMIWNFRETGRFIVRNGKSSAPNSAQEVQLNRAGLKQHGPPTEAYLPLYVRKILTDFFRDQGVLQPKCLMLSEDGVHFDFAISVESLGNPPQKEWQNIGEAVSWFLPSHYSIVLISEKGLPEFVSL